MNSISMRPDSDPVSHILDNLQEIETSFDEFKALGKDAQIFYDAKTGQFSKVNLSSDNKNKESRSSVSRPTQSMMEGRQVKSGSRLISREAVIATTKALERLQTMSQELVSLSDQILNSSSINLEFKQIVHKKINELNKKLHGDIERTLFNQNVDQELTEAYQTTQTILTISLLDSLKMLRNISISEEASTIQVQPQSEKIEIAPQPQGLPEKQEVILGSENSDSSNSNPILSHSNSPSQPSLIQTGPPPPPPPPGQSKKKIEEHLPEEPQAPSENLLTLKNLNQMSQETLKSEVEQLKPTVVAMQACVNGHQEKLKEMQDLAEKIRLNTVEVKSYEGIVSRVDSKLEAIKEQPNIPDNYQPVPITLRDKKDSRNLYVFADAFVDDYNQKVTQHNQSASKQSKLPLLPETLKASHVSNSLTTIKGEAQVELDHYRGIVQTTQSHLDEKVKTIPNNKSVSDYEKLIGERQKTLDKWNLALRRREQALEEKSKGKASIPTQPKEEVVIPQDTKTKFYHLNPHFDTVVQTLANIPSQTLNAANQNPLEAFRKILSDGEITS